MPKLTEISLDYDMTFQVKKAEKKDGYAETDESVTAINAQGVFPIVKKPIRFKTFEELMAYPTPPTIVKDVPMGYIKFQNDFLPIGDLTEDPEERGTRSRGISLALMRIQRQIAVKEAAEEGYTRLSESFKLISIGLTIVAVMAIVIIAVLVFSKGSPL